MNIQTIKNDLIACGRAKVPYAVIRQSSGAYAFVNRDRKALGEEKATPKLFIDYDKLESFHLCEGAEQEFNFRVGVVGVSEVYFFFHDGTAPWLSEDMKKAYTEKVLRFLKLIKIDQLAPPL
jgi:hypothetical protein